MCQCVWVTLSFSPRPEGACHGCALQGPELCRPGDKKQNTSVVDSGVSCDS
ncbi:hypothetical protein CDEST_05890 [Colletotrichum destructivum]|uniref:Uncharacterized protein n=1 Tax=Colletotrichum destructivum TaxID=34406 RepID=A0AAX4ICY9_9PEZI|nr:hypothetical protein CDEST_05890 [Colletotrichum destructivum]